MEKVIITGGCGFIGSHLGSALIEKGYNVHVIDNLFSGRRETKANLHIANVLDKEKVSNIIDKETRVVFHLAAHFGHPRSVKDAFLNLDVNTKGTLTLLEICRQRDIERFVYPSTFTVYGEQKSLPISEENPTHPRSLYDISKLAGENYVLSYNKLYGIKTVVLRLSNTYGPGDSQGIYRNVVPNFIFQILSGNPPTLHFEGKATRDFVYVDNVIQGFLKASLRKEVVGEVFNIASGIETSIKDLVMMIIDISGKNVQPILAPSPSIDYYSLRSVGSIEKARRFLGYEPKVGIEEGLRRTIEWCKRNWNVFSIPEPYSYLEK